MNKHHEKLIFFLFWVFIIYFTQVSIMSMLELFFTLPEWAMDVSFYIVAAFYTYLFIKYRIRILITMHHKKIFDYDNRRKS